MRRLRLGRRARRKRRVRLFGWIIREGELRGEREGGDKQGLRRNSRKAKKEEKGEGRGRSWAHNNDCLIGLCSSNVSFLCGCEG